MHGGADLQAELLPLKQRVRRFAGRSDSEDSNLEHENARLCRLVADLSLEKHVLATVASGHLKPPHDAGRKRLRSVRNTASRTELPAGSSDSTAARTTTRPPWRKMHWPVPLSSWRPSTDSIATAASSHCGRQTAGRSAKIWFNTSRAFSVSAELARWDSRGAERLVH